MVSKFDDTADHRRPRPGRGPLGHDRLPGDHRGVDRRARGQARRGPGPDRQRDLQPAAQGHGPPDRLHPAVRRAGHRSPQDRHPRPTRPYNTYKYKGLPPTPIASPGAPSLEAAAAAADHDLPVLRADRPERQARPSPRPPPSSPSCRPRPRPRGCSDPSASEPARAAWPGAATRVVGVIGDPVGHSLSPALHNAAFAALGLDWVYLAFPVPAGAGARRAGRDAGPRDRWPVGHHAPQGGGGGRRSTGSARPRPGWGRSTPWSGGAVGWPARAPTGTASWPRCASDEGWDPAGRRCLVLGTGGAARAVALALGQAGAAEVAVVGRRPRDGRGDRPAGRPGRPGRRASTRPTRPTWSSTPPRSAWPAWSASTASRCPRPSRSSSTRAGSAAASWSST